MTICTIPKELYKATANTWTSADFTCPLYSYFRQFSIYLSSFIIVCITIDRYILGILAQKLYATINFYESVASKFFILQVLGSAETSDII